MSVLEIIDAHHHLCQLSQAPYPWLQGPRIDRYHGDDFPLRRDYLVDDYVADTRELESLNAKLVGSIHVENGAADPMRESKWIDDVIVTNGIPSVQVVKVDLSAANVTEQLTEHATKASVRGVRDILNWHPNPYYSHRDRGDLMKDPNWLRGFGELSQFGLSFDLQVFPGQLADAAVLAANHGDTAIVLDHAGMPIGRDRDSLHQWRSGMALLAAEFNTAVKISALGTNDHRWTPDSIRQIVLDTIELFGPSRCMFGSNFPVDGLYSNFGELYAAFDAITSDFTDAERARLFAGTARKFYRIQT